MTPKLIKLSDFKVALRGIAENKSCEGGSTRAIDPGGGGGGPEIVRSGSIERVPQGKASASTQGLAECDQFQDWLCGNSMSCCSKAGNASDAPSCPVPAEMGGFNYVLGLEAMPAAGLASHVAGGRLTVSVLALGLVVVLDVGHLCWAATILSFGADGP